MKPTRTLHRALSMLLTAAMAYEALQGEDKVVFDLPSSTQS